RDPDVREFCRSLGLCRWPHDAALQFANTGKWQLKGIDLVKFNESAEMIEFEVMIRPIKALQALGEEMGNRIGPRLARLKEAAGAQG
ncbi:MAG TPA: hypothetical protein VIK28_08575, partial [Sedimentisphaerales bacterium]